MSSPASLDTFKSRKVLKVGAKSYEYFSLPDAEQNGLQGLSQFVSMRAVYAALPEELKHAVEDKVAIHDYAYSRRKVDPNLMTEVEHRTLPPVRQAMVLDHGKFGRSLYVGSHVAAIEGMDAAAGRALIDGSGMIGSSRCEGRSAAFPDSALSSTSRRPFRSAASPTTATSR